MVLVIATVLIARDYGRRSSLLRIALASITDLIQGILGLLAFDSDTIVVVHLNNAFVLAALATYLISFVDRADSAMASSATTKVSSI